MTRWSLIQHKYRREKVAFVSDAIGVVLGTFGHAIPKTLNYANAAKTLLGGATDAYLSLGRQDDFTVCRRAMERFKKAQNALKFEKDSDERLRLEGELRALQDLLIVKWA